MYNIIEFESLESTNKYIKNNIDVLNNKDVIFTKKQTNGKGRGNRIWYSSSDSLTFSIVIKDRKVIEMFASLSLLSASAVYLTLSKYIDKLSIKWPNDVYVNDSKICGILLESISLEKIEGIALGIGINVNNKTLDVNDRKVTSLYLCSNKEYDLVTILNEFLTNFEYLLQDLLKGNKKYLEIIINNNYLLNKEVTLDESISSLKGKVIGITDSNKLEVSINNKIIEVDIGEVNITK